MALADLVFVGEPAETLQVDFFGRWGVAEGVGRLCAMRLAEGVAAGGVSAVATSSGWVARRSGVPPNAASVTGWSSGRKS